MFSKQRQFVPKTLPKPKVKVRTVPVDSTPASSSGSSSKPRTPLDVAGTSTANASRKTPSRPSSSTPGALKRTASGRARYSDSPLASSSADERANASHLAPPTTSSSRHRHHSSSSNNNNSNNHISKRIRSPATDSDRGTRVAFEASSDEEDGADDDWEKRLKRRRHMARADPSRRLPSAALEDLAQRGYREGGNGPGGRALRFVHAADVVSLARGDARVFAKADPGELCVELQYPGSLTRERFELAKHKDKLDVVTDITRVVGNVHESGIFITDAGAKTELDSLYRQLKRYANENESIQNLPKFKEALDKYNQIVLDQLKSGAILKNIDRQHIPPNNLVSLILNQVYDRVVTPQVDLLKRYKNGTDNVYGEMNHNFVSKVLSEDLRMTSDQVFVDLGSGVGNVVLQAALEIGCESWGWETMEVPSQLAKSQLKEFKSRCRLWGIQPGKARIVRGDFTGEPFQPDDPRIGDVLKRADVVLANNQAFTPELNDRLKIMFLDLKKGCKIVSLKKFTTSSKHQLNDIANSILSEAEKYRWPGKGVSWTEEVGDYHISTKIEGNGA